MLLKRVVRGHWIPRNLSAFESVSCNKPMLLLHCIFCLPSLLFSPTIACKCRVIGLVLGSQNVSEILDHFIKSSKRSWTIQVARPLILFLVICLTIFYQKFYSLTITRDMCCINMSPSQLFYIRQT